MDSLAVFNAAIVITVYVYAVGLSRMTPSIPVLLPPDVLSHCLSSAQTCRGDRGGVEGQ